MQLVVNTFGASVRKEGERFLVMAGEKSFPVSVHKVQSILITTGAHLSTDAIQLAVENNVDIVFLDKYGQPYGRVWHAKMGSTAAIRRRQIEVAEAEEGLKFVLEWVTAKLGNQLELLKQLQRRRPARQELFDSPIETIANSKDKLSQLTGTLAERQETIRGLEGTAGRAYFGTLGQLLPEAYRFTTRSRHPAKDEFNALLNYAYGVLYSLVEKACITAGLDPFVGFLHADNYNKKSLVYDLIEPFRILGEKVVVYLFTGRQIKQEYFEKVKGGVTISQDGKALLITSLNEDLEKTVRYPVASGSGKTRNIKQRDVIQYEAHALANALLGREGMPKVVETRALVEEDSQRIEDGSE